MVDKAYQSPGLWLGTSGTLMVQVWGTDVAGADIDALSALFTQLSPNGKTAVTTTSVIRPSGLPKLSPEIRRKIDELTKRTQDSVVASANIVEGSGFAAAGTRALITGLLVFDKKTKTFSTIKEAAAWIGNTPATGLDEQSVTQALLESCALAAQPA